MSIETAVVFDEEMKPIFWHTPLNRSAGHIGDSRGLWKVLMENRDKVFGIAHSHPGGGKAAPSGIDLRTFSACDLGLGKRLIWPIISKDSVRLFTWLGPEKYSYSQVFYDGKLYWLDGLMQLSYGGKNERFNVI